MFKNIKYKVTGAFGLEPIGSIVDSILLFSALDSNIHLIFHPSDKKKDYCASLEMCKKIDYYYVTCNENIYINISKKQEKIILLFIKLQEIF